MTVSSTARWEDHDFPPPYRNASQIALAHRSMTLPYRYTLAHEAKRTGLSPTRPMYYSWPWEAQSYDVDITGRQFMLGESVLVAPVTTPLSCGNGPTQADQNSTNCSTGTATTSLWLPSASANWLPAFNNSPPLPLMGAGAVVNVSSSLGDVPVYVERGTVLPTLPYAAAIKHGSASRAFDPLTWLIYGPEASGGSGHAVEDDGMTTETSAVSLDMKYTVSGGCVNMTATAVGGYFGAPTTRQYSFKVVKPALFCEEVETQAAAAAVFDASGAVMQHLDDCARRIRGGTTQEPGWCVEPGSGDLFVQLPRVGHVEAASASVCGLCA